MLNKLVYSGTEEVCGANVPIEEYESVEEYEGEVYDAVKALLDEGEEFPETITIDDIEVYVDDFLSNSEIKELKNGN